MSQVDQCVRLLLGSVNRGRPRKAWTAMTPTRLGHSCELIREGKFPVDVIIAACNRINASGWLNKSPLEVTDEEVADLLESQPWEQPLFKGQS